MDNLTNYNNILKKYFGYDALKPQQFQIIDAIINKQKDVSAVLATGFGKSICYQLPFVITNKNVLVISPLIALMADQSYDMQNKNIPVCIFNSDTSKKEYAKYRKELRDGKTKIIYTTPEFFIKSQEFMEEMKDTLLMICIDEAHAVSTWGLDFRSSYTKLNVIKEWLPNTPILTLTATASEKVKVDIKTILNLDEPIEIIGDFNRPNLYIEAVEKNINYIYKIINLIKKYPNDYTIIYATTRDETEKLAEILNSKDIKCKAYHAGMSSEDRKQIQDDYIAGEYKCMIATIAFGMGINIPNVRLVIHNNCPKNLESYYQEIGRAGRDNVKSECYMFYANKDFTRNKTFIKDIQDKDHKEYHEQQIRNMEKYVHTKECRRKLLLANFGQEIVNCDNCDNCINNVVAEEENKVDYTTEFIILLNAIKVVHNKFGLSTIIKMLTGKKLKDFMMNQPFYGMGKENGSEDWWKLFARELINNDYIIETQRAGAFGTTCGLTNKGLKELGKNNNFMLNIIIDPKQKIKKIVKKK